MNGRSTGILISGRDQSISALYLQRINIYNSLNSALKVDGSAHLVNDIYLNTFIFNGTADSNVDHINGAIYLYGAVQAFTAAFGECIGGNYPMHLTSTSGGPSAPEFNKFTNIYFDSGYRGVWLEYSSDSLFTGCWFSGGRTGNDSGVVVDEAQGTSFTNCIFANCGEHGASVTSNAAYTTFVGCKAEGNSYSTGTGVSHGIAIGNNSAKFNIIGCSSYNPSYFSGQQGYGIFVGSGCQDFNITGNQLTGNYTAGLIDGTSTTTRKHIANNTGTNIGTASGCKYNNVLSSRTAGTTYTNNTVEPILVTVVSAASAADTIEIRVNGVALNTVSMPASTFATVSATVPPGGNYYYQSLYGGSFPAGWTESSGTCS